MNDYFIRNAVRLRNRRRRRHFRVRLRSLILLVTFYCVVLTVFHYGGEIMSQQLLASWATWRSLPAFEIIAALSIAFAVASSAMFWVITFALRPSRGIWVVGVLVAGAYLGFLFWCGADVSALDGARLEDVSFEQVAYVGSLPPLLLLPVGSILGWIAAIRESDV